MTLLEAACLIAVAAMAGGVNAVAGGGSVLVFPTLLFLGVPPLQANATCTAALCPGAVASAWGYRRDLPSERKILVVLLGASVVGGVLGALGVLATPPELLVRLVPLLIGIAALIFTFGPHLRAALERVGKPPLAVIAFGQVIISVYGGYFGGGMSLMILALLTLLGPSHLHAMNGIKSVLGIAINGAALVPFVLSGAIDWPRALIMIVGAVAGGYLTASRARLIDPRIVRRGIIVLAWTTTIVLALKS